MSTTTNSISFGCEQTHDRLYIRDRAQPAPAARGPSFLRLRDALLDFRRPELAATPRGGRELRRERGLDARCSFP